MPPCQPRRAQPAASSMPNWGQSGGMGRAHSSTRANRACPAVASAKADLPHVLLAGPDEPRGPGERIKPGHLLHGRGALKEGGSRRRIVSNSRE